MNFLQIRIIITIITNMDQILDDSRNYGPIRKHLTEVFYKKAALKNFKVLARKYLY